MSQRDAWTSNQAKKSPTTSLGGRTWLNPSVSPPHEINNKIKLECLRCENTTQVVFTLVPNCLCERGLK